MNKIEITQPAGQQNGPPRGFVELRGKRYADIYELYSIAIASILPGEYVDHPSLGRTAIVWRGAFRITHCPAPVDRCERLIIDRKWPDRDLQRAMLELRRKPGGGWKVVKHAGAWWVERFVTEVEEVSA